MRTFGGRVSACGKAICLELCCVGHRMRPLHRSTRLGTISKLDVHCSLQHTTTFISRFDTKRCDSHGPACGENGDKRARKSILINALFPALLWQPLRSITSMITCAWVRPTGGVSVLASIDSAVRSPPHDRPWTYTTHTCNYYSFLRQARGNLKITQKPKLRESKLLQWSRSCSIRYKRPWPSVTICSGYHTEFSPRPTWNLSSNATHTLRRGTVVLVTIARAPEHILFEYAYAQQNPSSVNPNANCRKKKKLKHIQKPFSRQETHHTTPPNVWRPCASSTNTSAERYAAKYKWTYVTKITQTEMRIRRIGEKK